MTVRYRTLGSSGLVVHPMSLGTMTFGTDRWGSDESTSLKIFERYLEAGGNVIDTANIYAQGSGERMIGRILQQTGTRDDIVLATKFGFNTSGNHRDGTPTGRNGLHAGGASAKHIREALEASLRRLQTDWIDLYWMHVWDGITPSSEVVRTLGELVEAGKIRYFAFSDTPAWFASKSAAIATERGRPGPIALQVEYSLVARDVEAEHIPSARASGMGVVPWSPLAGGLLTGKYSEDRRPHDARLSGVNPFRESKFTERNWKILKVLKEVAEEASATPAQTALSWVMSRPGISSTLVGARSVGQLQENLEALKLNLTSGQLGRLDDASAPERTFTVRLTGHSIRRRLFGGVDVDGWRDQRP